MKENTLYLITGNRFGHGYTEGETLVAVLADGNHSDGAYEVTAGPDDTQNFLVVPEEVEEVGTF